MLCLLYKGGVETGVLQNTVSRESLVAVASFTVETVDVEPYLL